MLLCHFYKSAMLLHHKICFPPPSKTWNNKMRKVSMECSVPLYFPYPWVIGPERTRSWCHQKFLVDDPFLSGGMAKGNVGWLKALGLLSLESFLPSIWVGPYWTKEEDETIISYIPPSSFTLPQDQWCFSKKSLSESWSLWPPLEPS